MKFLLHGRVGTYLLREEIKIPTLDEAIEEAKRRIAKRAGGGGDITVELRLTPPVWEFDGHYDGEAVVTIRERIGSVLDH